jgi:hypothetical protein
MRNDGNLAFEGARTPNCVERESPADGAKAQLGPALSRHGPSANPLGVGRTLSSVITGGVSLSVRPDTRFKASAQEACLAPRP